jgi:hypothetical protein
LARPGSAEGLALRATDQQEELVLQVYCRQVFRVQLQEVTEDLRLRSSFD